MRTVFEGVALVASCILPFFNLPLIIKIVRRKSSADLSLTWVIGVWTCFILMFPAGLMSQDIVFRVFSIMNITFFSVVMIVAVKYRK